ncbi:FecR domain-containing protein [Falsiruegeria mediterranea]|uniref:Bacillopeptidase F n=1 Tax=Falsiruegeria mediterranea M17 TaxID=1200281 RepID=A0A2R8C9L3_9RHOB|nr:FecR domain-containing protein [Falsiruegeria mediterranea]SPJ29134.1 Bacillopeptidase F [Falsiruegeria mediterranea M17]
MKFRLTKALTICLGACLGTGAALAESDPLDAPLQIVEFKQGDTLRGVVGEHLRDPDLWPAVLKLNNIGSSADLVPGTQLRLPVRQVATADAALLSSLQAIQKANAEGARIFAPDEIGQAIQSRDEAVTSREVGEWREVVNYAGVARDFAREALDISIAQRDRSAEAVVSDVQGDVEGRAPVEPSWSDRNRNDILVEFERIRTLSASTTQVTFRDLSRLRLNPNSNATIQRMRSDPLTGGEVTKVSLAEGDFYALLNQLSDKTTFEIDVPGIETTTNSADFWIKNDQSGARFVNYDTPGLEIERDGQTFELGENEGVVIAGTGAQRAEVLTSPLLNLPGVGEILYSESASLSWEVFSGAEAYWLEVASDPGFNQMQISEWGIRDTAFAATGLKPARYHWRVAALDKLGLPGEWSTPRDFTLRIDNTPPFLTLMSPAAGTIATKPRIEVLGATELEATLTLDGKPLKVDGDGSFVADVDLTPGENVIEVVAIDLAGNTSRRSQSVIYRPSAEVEIALSDQIARVDQALASRTDQLSVSASTTAEPGAAVLVRDASDTVVVQTQVGAAGSIGFTVPVDEAAREFTIQILAPGGAVEGALRFAAIRDQIAPEITLDLPPPRATSDDVLSVTGAVGDAVRLTLNGTDLPVQDGRFDLTVTLAPGPNAFELVAVDAVGNVSVTRLNTLLDVDPPEVLSVELGRPQGDTGPIEIDVQARDASGLRQAAPFVISVDGVEIEGFLRCDSVSGLCRAVLPPETGELELVELIIEDYAGNTAFE